MFSGWSILRWTALGTGLWIAVVLVLRGGPEAGLPEVIRGTARTSFVLFMTAFSGPGFAQLHPSPLSRWMAVNERYLFTGFVFVHLVHAAAIWTLAGITRLQSLGGSVEPYHFSGSVVYLFLVGIGLRKVLDLPVAGRFGRGLESVGLYLIWASYAAAYVLRSTHSPVWIPLALLAVAGLVLRVVGERRKR